ncbi:C3a anaphylatoxin chemotactic receptor-like [Engystomops pustulosus]|uniref:C3a anaphylatoxin chemotactic receptor-like n=1 Tax=Engystomops pustulosus TaxID=76066 RepID=UPI003AFA631C
MDRADSNWTFEDVTPNYNQSYYIDYETTNETSNSGFGNILQRTSVTLLYSIVSILGIIGNGLVIWIAGFKMKTTLSVVWVLHLAIADLLCCASLLLRILEWLHYYTSRPYFLCEMSIILFHVYMNARVLLLAAMMFDFIVVSKLPFWTTLQRRCKLVVISATSSWVMSFIWTGLAFSYLFYDLDEWCPWMYEHRNNDLSDHKPTIHLIRFLLMFIIPILIILTSYLNIFLKLRTSKWSPWRTQRLFWIITAVILCFCICWFPYNLWPLMTTYDGPNIQFSASHFIIFILACLNSCTNPIIYVVLGQDFNHSFLRSISLGLKRSLNYDFNYEVSTPWRHGLPLNNIVAADTGHGHQ